MKKKKPTLTHYTKKLKNVRLARTVTVIATLFVSGVVVAANVLPQVIKSNAATTADTTNDVIAGGVDQFNGANAKAQIIQKVFRDTSDQGQSAKALYTKLGITEAMIQGSTFKWLYGPNYSQPKNPSQGLIAEFGNWRSFGRNNGPGFIPLEVVYGTKTATFYHKPFSQMHPNTWGSGTSAEPVLIDPSGNPKWFVVLTCGNPVVPQIPSNPTASATKVISKVTRGGQTVDHKAAGFKLRVKDQITYYLSAKNGSVAYPAGFQVGDGVPPNTKFVTQNSSWPSGTTFVNPIPVVNGQQYPTWRFAQLAPNQIVNINYVVEVTGVGNGTICNFAIWVNNPNQTIPNRTPDVCLPVQGETPALKITKKKAANTPSSVKVGDQLTFDIEMTNTGTAAAANAKAYDVLRKDSAGKLTQTFVSLGALKVTKISDGSTVNVTSHAVKDAASQQQYASGEPNAYGYHLDSMPAGTKLTFSVTVKAAILPQACDIAIGNFDNSGNPLAITLTEDVCVPVIDENKPHITVEKRLQPGRAKVNPGQTVNYTVIVRNTSTKAAQTSEITVTDMFDPTGYAKDIKINSAKGSWSGASVPAPTMNANGFVAKIPRMPANSSVVYEVSVKVSDTAAEGQQFCNNATITMTPANTIVSETSSTVCSTVTLVKLNKTAKYVSRSDDPQKSPANAGDEVEYTLTTTNLASTAKEAYIVTEDLSDVLYYADVTDAGGGTLTGNKLIWPAKTIAANGGKLTNTFKVKVKNPVPNNAASGSNPTNYDYNMFNEYGDQVNIKINKPLIQQVIDVASNLPETGAASYLLIIVFLGMSVYFFVRNRQLTSELAAATVEYQHQASAGAVTEAQNLIHPEEDTSSQEPPATPPAA